MARLKILTAAGLFLFANFGASAGWLAGVETGAVFSGYNDVRVPNDGGTDISLSRDLDADPAFFYRINAGYTFGEKHAIGVLVAPLTLKAGGSVPRTVVFDDVEIPANAPIDATYRFDSYRVSYRYNIVRRDKFNFGLGATAKVRDAAITLKSGALEGETTNTGIVPLLNFGLRWTFADGWTLIFDGDALAGPQGRAEDVLVAVQYDVNDHFSLKSGYRMLEGGADVDQVYNFAMLHYIVLGPSFEF